MDYSVCSELCAYELLVFDWQQLPLVIRRWSKFALSSGDCRLFVADHAAQMPHLLQYGGFSCQAPSPNQFPPRHPGFGTHRCYHRLNEPLPDVLVRLAPFWARQIPWFVLLFSRGAWVALIEHCPHSAREKDSGVMAGGCVTSSSGSCPFRFVAFPIRIPRCRRSRLFIVLDCPLGVLADWSQWSWVQCRVSIRSDCRPRE